MREMKDSGIAWIGNIPISWNLRRLKACFIQRDGGAWGEEAVGDNGDTICLRIADFDYERFRFKNLPQDSYTVRHYTVDQIRNLQLTAGDILIEKSGGGEKTPVGRTVIFDKSFLALFANFMDRLKCHSSVHPLFMQYVLVTFYKNEYTRNYIKQTTGIQNLDLTSMLASETIALPDLEEQIRIAAFLDKKCADIDAIVERTRESIIEYKKMRHAVIAQAITKGVRGKRAMKESGLEWVPELPVEWTTIPSKFLFRNSDLRKQPDDEQLTASQKYGIISQREYMERENTKIVLANKGLEDWKHVEPYDFVISLRSFQGGLEMSETTGCITWHYIVLKPCKPIVSKYFKWLFKSEIYIKALQRTCNFIRDGQDLRYSNFVQVPLFEPPLDEQQEIADYLDQKCAEIDDLIAKKEQFLVELENYKKALIYEYVTGKKEVPAEQPTTMSIVYPYFPAALNTDKRRFAQAILMCRILDKCRKKMGRVKLEKMLYTIESSIGFDLETEYVREAAGPLDASIYECERIISKRNKWYTLKSSSYGVSYAPTKDCGKYEKYYDKYFASYDAEIDRIINIFMNYDADQAEIVATLFAAWNDFIIDQRQFSDEELVDEVLNNWNDSKKRFSRDVWLRAIDQMRKNSIIPNGYGKRTVVKN